MDCNRQGILLKSKNQVSMALRDTWCVFMSCNDLIKPKSNATHRLDKWLFTGVRWEREVDPKLVKATTSRCGSDQFLIRGEVWWSSEELLPFDFTTLLSSLRKMQSELERVVDECEALLMALLLRLVLVGLPQLSQHGSLTSHCFPSC